MSLTPDEIKRSNAARRAMGYLPPEDEGFFGGIQKGAKRAFVQAVGGIGSTIEELMPEESADVYGNKPGSGLRKWGEDTLRYNQQWRDSGGTAEKIGGYIGSGVTSTAIAVPAMAADVALGSKGALSFAFFFGQTFGDNVKRNREAYGTDNEAKNYGLAAAESCFDALVETSLGSIPMVGKSIKGLSYAGKRALVEGMVKQAEKELGRGAAHRFFLNVAKNGLEEGAEEVMQYCNSWIWRELGGDPNNRFNLGEMGEAGLAGTVGGLALGPIGGRQNVELYGKNRPWLNRQIAIDTGKAVPFTNEVNGRSYEGLYLPTGDVKFKPPAATMEPGATPDLAPVSREERQSIAEALYDELGIKHRRMTDEEVNTEGIGYVMRDGERFDTNGLFNSKTNEILIHPQNEGELFSHGHELDHYLTQNAPELADALHQIMDEQRSETGEALRKTSENIDEFHADMLGKIIQDPETLRAIADDLDARTAGFGEQFLKQLIEFCKKVMAFAKRNADKIGAEQFFNDYKAVRDAAAKQLVELKRKNGTSTEAENVKGVHGSENVESIPVAELNIDPARFQFKSKADKVTGVDESNQIGGAWDPKTAGNLYVWEDRDGRKFVVNGHHRFALAKSQNVEKVNAIVDRESDGVTAEQARKNGILINIRDEQGDVRDYADFVRSEKLDEDTAEREGVLNRQKGKLGFLIGKYASDNLYTIYRSGDISDAKAAAIADIARGDEGLEAAGIRAAKNNMPGAQLVEFLKVLKNTPRQQSEQGDLFGFDDSALQTAETLAKLAAKHIKEVSENLRAAKNAINNPEAAKKLGVTVRKNAEKLKAQAEQEAARWDHWYTDPELSAQLRKEAGIEETPKAAEETPQAAEQEAGTGKASETNTDLNGEKRSETETPGDGRFNIDSDAPLLSAEEDANDFQLAAETPAEAAKREQQERAAEERQKERARQEAFRNSPDLPMEEGTAAEQQSKIEDFGEKIGGARKDLAEKTGPRESRTGQQESNGTPKWRKDYIITPDGDKWTVYKDLGNGMVRRAFRQDFSSLEEAEAALPAAYISDKFRFYTTNSGKYAVYRYRKSGSVPVRGGFETMQDAQKWALQHVDELDTLRPGRGERDLATKPDYQRTGERRLDHDATAKDFSDSFGFRGVEFGNWENQRERQQLMNDAYEALHDLAELLNIPPQAISLEGQLGLAFGARGHGGDARAHYEPDYVVINLSKPSGAGTFAHEWFHALDNYFRKQAMKQTEWSDQYLSDTSRLPKDSGMRQELFDKFKAIKEAIQKFERPPTEEELAGYRKYLADSKERLGTEIAHLRDTLANPEQENQYRKRKLAPATEEQLREFDAIAKKLLADDAAKLEWDGWAQTWINDDFKNLSRLYKSITGRSGFTKNGYSPLAELVSAAQSLARARERLDARVTERTSFYDGARELDSRRSSEYWSQPWELFSRAFSAFIEDKLTAAKRKSEFLSYGSDNALYNLWALDEADRIRPFPEGKERQRINAAFQDFFDTLKTETTPEGKTRLYSLRKGESESEYEGQSRKKENILLQSADPEIRQAVLKRSAQTRKEAEDALDTLAGRDIVNRETGTPAQVNRTQRDKLVSDKARKKSNSNGFSNSAHFRAVANIDALFENASKVDDRDDLDGNPDILSIKRFVAPAIIDGEFAEAYITVKETVGNKIYSLELDELKKPSGIQGSTLPKDRYYIPEGYDKLLQKVEKAREFLEKNGKIADETSGTSRTDETNGPNDGPAIQHSVRHVWTGSAADYEQPSLHYVGSGEGAQVYGWGLYGSSSEKVARWYAEGDVARKGTPDVLWDGVPSDHFFRHLRWNLKNKGEDYLKSREYLQLSALQNILKHVEGDVDRVIAICQKEAKFAEEHGRQEEADINRYRIKLLEQYRDRIKWHPGNGMQIKFNGETLRGKSGDLERAVVRKIADAIKKTHPDPEFEDKFFGDSVYAAIEDVMAAMQRRGDNDFYEAATDSANLELQFSGRSVATKIKDALVELSVPGQSMFAIEGKTAPRNLYDQTFWPGKQENLLDWEKNVPPNVVEQIKKALDKEEKTVDWDRYDALSGEAFYQRLSKALGSPKAASEFLYRAGIDGITYVGDSSGVRNYVAFSDKDIRVDNHYQYSLRKHQQVNPVIANGQVRAEYADLLNDRDFPAEHIAEWDQKAIEWITSRGGVRPAAELIAEGTAPVDRHVATLVRRHLMENDVFNTLPEKVRADVLEQYATAGTNWGREGVARRIAALTLDSIEKVRALFRKLHEDMPDAEKQKLRNDILKDVGIDIFNLPDDLVNDKPKLDKLLRAELARQSTWPNKAYEYWINAILSAPTTHASNVIGNTANALYELGVKRFGEAALNTVFKRKDAATFGEFREMWRHLDFKNAWKKALEAFDLETLTPGGKFREHANVAIGGRLGRAIRTPGRLLTAADAFARELYIPIEAASRAYREAKSRGLKGSEMQKYIREQLTNPASQAYQAGIKSAEEIIFQEDPGEFVRRLIAFKQGTGPGAAITRFMLPFVKTPYNLLKQGIRKGPLGALNLAIETGQVALGKRSIDSKYLGHVAEQIVAWGAFLALKGLDDDDDEHPFLTGSSPAYGSGEQKFKANEVPPYSIRIGDTYYSYRRIEPLATGLAAIADGMQAIREMRSGRSVSAALGSMLRKQSKMISEKSYLDSLKQVYQIAEDPAQFEKVVPNFVSSWVPNAVRSASFAWQDQVGDFKSREKGEDFWRDQFWITAGRAGLTRRVPKVDLFGHEITREDADSTGDFGDVLWRLLVPVSRRNIDESHPGKRLILRYNASHPDAQWWGSLPNYQFTHEKRKYYLGNEDYHDFAVESGKLAEKQIQYAMRHGLLNVNNPGEKDIDLVKKIFARARKETRMKYLRQHRARTVATE